MLAHLDRGRKYRGRVFSRSRDVLLIPVVEGGEGKALRPLLVGCISR